MVLSKVLTKCAAICAAATCAVTIAHADPLAYSSHSAHNATPSSDIQGPLSRARVPRIALDDDVYLPTAHLNEKIIRVPVDATGTVTLETTIYKPDGPGPFPMIVFNHGKIPGDPRTQERSDPLAFAREFVRRGYVVVAPNRQGFGHSDGVYEQDGCDVERNGLGQASDIAATIDYMLCGFDRLFAKAQRRRAMHERFDKILRARPRTEPRSRVDMPRIAEIDERAAETLREIARVGERHPRIGFAADQNRRHAQTSRVERSREFEPARTRGRDEQHADHVAGKRALLQRMTSR